MKEQRLRARRRVSDQRSHCRSARHLHSQIVIPLLAASVVVAIVATVVGVSEMSEIIEPVDRRQHRSRPSRPSARGSRIAAGCSPARGAARRGRAAHGRDRRGRAPSRSTRRRSPSSSSARVGQSHLESSERRDSQQHDNLMLLDRDGRRRSRARARSTSPAGRCSSTRGDTQWTGLGMKFTTFLRLGGPGDARRASTGTDADGGRYALAVSDARRRGVPLGRLFGGLGHAVRVLRRLEEAGRRAYVDAPSAGRRARRRGLADRLPNDRASSRSLEPGAPAFRDVPRAAARRIACFARAAPLRDGPRPVAGARLPRRCGRARRSRSRSGRTTMRLIALLVGPRRRDPHRLRAVRRATRLGAARRRCPTSARRVADGDFTPEGRGRGAQRGRGPRATASTR